MMAMKRLMLASLIGAASASCPNSCSGHGTCDNNDQCTCFLETTEYISDSMSLSDLKFGKDADKRFQGTIEVEWTGADCSERTCPRGVSWSQTDGNCAHKAEAECSDKGTCDRSTGTCTCYPGYTGAWCQRTACPNDCSGHGTCRSNLDFAYDWEVAKTRQLLGGHAVNNETETFEQNYVATYDSAWDSGLQYGCKCDVGYRGPDCAQIECPSGKDYLDVDKCKDEITDFQIQKFAGTGAQGWITAYAEAEAPEYQGNASKAIQNEHFINGVIYSCYGAMAGQDCSGRGLCNYNTGTCKCYVGYTGTACEEVEQVA